MGTTVSGETKSRRNWSIASEIDWGKVDLAAARMDGELLMMARRAAIRAARRTVGLSHLLAALAADAVASALLARELHDSWKHFHALRSYLEVVEYSPGIAETELDQQRRTAPEVAPRRNDDIAARMAHLVDEASSDGAAFGLISRRAMDPALARLANRIASDRQQHSLALARYLAQGATSVSEKTA